MWVAVSDNVIDRRPQNLVVVDGHGSAFNT